MTDLVERLAALHEAAKGREFDLVPSDGPIAQLALFMHESGDELCAEIARLTAEVERLRKALFNATALIGHRMPMDATALVAGETLVAREVWQQGKDALAANEDCVVTPLYPLPGERG